jgi:hypothetical protein
LLERVHDRILDTLAAMPAVAKEDEPTASAASTPTA